MQLDVLYSRPKFVPACSIEESVEEAKQPQLLVVVFSTSVYCITSYNSQNVFEKSCLSPLIVCQSLCLTLYHIPLLYLFGTLRFPSRPPQTILSF